MKRRRYYISTCSTKFCTIRIYAACLRRSVSIRSISIRLYVAGGPGGRAGRARRSISLVTQMSIYLRELSHHTAVEHSLLAQQIAAPAVAAMSQCSATVWDSSDERQDSEPLPAVAAPGATADVWYLLRWIFSWELISLHWNSVPFLLQVELNAGCNRYWMVGCTTAVGPGLAFRLGALLVGPRLVRGALARFE